MSAVKNQRRLTAAGKFWLAFLASHIAVAVVIAISLFGGF